MRHAALPAPPPAAPRRARADGDGRAHLLVPPGGAALSRLGAALVRSGALRSARLGRGAAAAPEMLATHPKCDADFSAPGAGLAEDALPAMRELWLTASAASAPVTAAAAAAPDEAATDEEAAAAAASAAARAARAKAAAPVPSGAARPTRSARAAASAALELAARRTIALAAVTFRSPLSLARSLASWRRAGLLDLVDERMLFVNRGAAGDAGADADFAAELALARDFGFDVYTAGDEFDGNVMAGPALAYLAGNASADYVLFVEKDFAVAREREGEAGSLERDATTREWVTSGAAARSAAQQCAERRSDARSCEVAQWAVPRPSRKRHRVLTERRSAPLPLHSRAGFLRQCSC